MTAAETAYRFGRPTIKAQAGDSAKKAKKSAALTEDIIGNLKKAIEIDPKNRRPPRPPRAHVPRGGSRRRPGLDRRAAGLERALQGPERQSGDEDLLAALAQVTNWRRSGDVIELQGATTLRFRLMTN